MNGKVSRNGTQSPDWLRSLRSLVQQKPLVIFRLAEGEIFEIEHSYLGLSRFTFARAHGLFHNVRAPTVCLIFVEGEFEEPTAYFALLSSRKRATTLESRVKIEYAQKIRPQRVQGLLELIDDRAMATNLRNRLAKHDSVTPLSPKLSAAVVDRLAEHEGNPAAMQIAIANLDEPKRYTRNAALQQDAVSMALGMFGIGMHERASLLEVSPEGETALSRVNIYEDVVIQEHARRVPGFGLIGEEDLTGRAVFEKGLERLEVITANKLPLEKVFGVDLIYYNATKQNIVMVQYKMLEPEKNDHDTDWIYRPDDQLVKEIARMKQFSKAQPPGPLEYRINPQVFYLKFVRRDALLGKSTQTMPIDHFEVLQRDPKFEGPRGGFRISYDTLDGRYLRQNPFFDLIRSGYIGAHADTTAALKTLVDSTLNNSRAVVAAIQAHREFDRVVE
jgi:hypothetical protein